MDEVAQRYADEPKVKIGENDNGQGCMKMFPIGGPQLEKIDNDGIFIKDAHSFKCVYGQAPKKEIEIDGVPLRYTCKFSTDCGVNELLVVTVGFIPSAVFHGEGNDVGKNAPEFYFLEGGHVFRVLEGENPSLKRLFIDDIELKHTCGYKIVANSLEAVEVHISFYVSSLEYVYRSQDNEEEE